MAAQQTLMLQMNNPRQREHAAQMIAALVREGVGFKAEQHHQDAGRFDSTVVITFNGSY